VVASGRADLVDPSFLAVAGAEPTGTRLPAGYRLGRPSSPDLPVEERVHLPERVPVRRAADAWVGYDSADGPLLVGREGSCQLPGRGRHDGRHPDHGRYHWQPPDLADPGNPLVPHSQIGTVSPYVEVARVFAREATHPGGLRVEPVAAHEPVAVSCWRSAGAIHVLLGNLESGWMGDARFSRRVRLRASAARLGLDPTVAHVALPVNHPGDPVPVLVDRASDEVSLDLVVGPAACLVVRIEPRR
jgi:hypothetical protein